MAPARPLHGPNFRAAFRLRQDKQTKPFFAGHRREAGSISIGTSIRPDAVTNTVHRPHPSGNGVQFCSTTQQTPAGGDPTGPCLQRLVGG